MPVEKGEYIKPPFRWAGGKQSIIGKIALYKPLCRINKYYEPFLGAGSMFFNCNYPDSILSDQNGPLINCFQKIKDTPLDLHSRLMYMEQKLDRQYYYKIRDTYNKNLMVFDINQAARFLFLVNTSFNGIYRVNRKGEYNVPFGKDNPAFMSENHILRLSNRLSNAIIKPCSYTEITQDVLQGDFIYMDPPYPPLNGTSSFQHYTPDKFPIKQQERVAEVASSLHDRGAMVLITNADTELIREIYRGWNIVELEVTRCISSKKVKHKVKELIIKNY